jgi:predicted transcriptional regulator
MADKLIFQKVYIYITTPFLGVWGVVDSKIVSRNPKKTQFTRNVTRNYKSASKSAYFLPGR